MVERRDRGLQALEQRVVQRLLLLDRREQIRLLALEKAHESGLPFPDPRDRDLVEKSLRAGVDHGHLLGERHRLVLVLLEQLGQPRAALELVSRLGVEVRRELGEGRQLAVLGEVEAQLPRDLPHRLGLSVATDARDADADVQRGPLARVEEVGLQVDLTIGDGDHVGRNEGRDVVRLRLDHGQRGQRAPAIGLVHLRCTLEQP